MKVILLLLQISQVICEKDYKQFLAQIHIENKEGHNLTPQNPVGKKAGDQNEGPHFH